MLHSYIHPSVTPKRTVHSSRTGKGKTLAVAETDTSAIDTSEDLISRLVQKAKEENLDIVSLLAKHISVTEVQI